MTDDSRTPERSFLRRWSQRKLAASREARAPAEPAPKVGPAPAAATPTAAATANATAQQAAAAPLPPVESLSFDSDFTAFLQPEVGESLKRQALRKLFADPRFNVMDGLDVYIDDYGKSEPIPPELVAQLNQAKFLFDPPKTRVNEHGQVEDVPDEPRADAGPEPGDDPPAIAGDDTTAVDSAPEPAQAAIVDNATNGQPIETSGPSVKLPLPPEET